MTPGKEGPPTDEELKWISAAAEKAWAGKWASGLLEDGRLVVWIRNKNEPCFVFPLNGDSPEILDYSPETKERSDVKRICDYALSLREALIKLRKWGAENGAGYVGATAHNALFPALQEERIVRD